MLDGSLQITIQKFFEQWTAAFDRFDAEAIADHMNVPLTIVAKEGAVALTQRSQVVANFEGVNEVHRNLGYHHAVLEDLDVFPTYAPNVVRAETTWAFRRVDDTLIYRFRMIYILGDYGHGWKAVVAINVDEASN